MRTKVFIFAMIATLLFGAGCDKAQQAKTSILGKWQIEATGESEEDMMPYDPYKINQDYFEFRQDNTVWHYCATCVGEKYFQVATYKIDSKHFSWYNPGSDEPEVYKYEFYGDKLKITSVSPRYAGNLTILISNVVVYKRVK
ncbi:MAG: hypothetical protein GX993_03530 [Bacteroidales bacterium]|nr:hypothetical protein [Bacteroidales bacterium]